MIVQDLREIGNKLYDIRKSKGMSRLEVAEYAGLSDRTYADIERGSVNMRLTTLLSICAALNITPDEILTAQDPAAPDYDTLLQRLSHCSPKEVQTTLNLLSIYLDSINK